MSYRYIPKAVKETVSSRDGYSGPGRVVKEFFNGPPNYHHIDQYKDGGKQTENNMIALGEDRHKNMRGHEAEYKQELKELIKERDRLDAPINAINDMIGKRPVSATIDMLSGKRKGK